MILFVDTDSPTATSIANRAAAPQRLHALLATLGRYANRVEVILSAPWTAGCSLRELQAELSPPVARAIGGLLWEDVPPLALGRHDHILYWLTRRYVGRFPAWLAVQANDEAWPEDRRGEVVLADAARYSDQAALALRRKLESYYWWDLWWGEGAPPDAPVLWRAHALMVAWCVARSRWPVVLGRTASEVALRLDFLLTIHAGAQHRVRRGDWFPHWVHLPQAGLEMRRPIELIEQNGEKGIARVLDPVWRQLDSASVQVS